MNKKLGCGLGCFGCLSLFVSIFSLVMFLTRPVVEAGETFLGLIAQEKFSEAYASMATSSKSGLSEEQFKTYAIDCKVNQYASASWRNRKLENDRGYLKGRFTTKSGESYPIDVFLIKEGDVWKVLDYQVFNAGSVPAASSSPGAVAPVDATHSGLTPGPAETP